MKTTIVLSGAALSFALSLVTGCASTAPVQPAAAPREERVEPAKITPPPSDFIEFAVQTPASKKADKKKGDVDGDGVEDAPDPSTSMAPAKSAQGKLQIPR